MSNLSIEIHDATGTKKQPVEVPGDAPISRLVAVLIERLKFPQLGPDGQLLSYRLQHRTTGRQLLESQTLKEAGVASGDVLRLVPEITAGRRIRSGCIEFGSAALE